MTRDMILSANLISLAEALTIDAGARPRITVSRVKRPIFDVAGDDAETAFLDVAFDLDLLPEVPFRR